MTRHLIDFASYQGSLKLADVKRAGNTAVNFKISHGVGQGAAEDARDLPRDAAAAARRIRAGSVHPNLPGLVTEAKSLGLAIGTFHWLIGNMSGTAQADYAYQRMRALGIDRGTAHTVDVEEQADADTETPPSWAVVMSYLIRMRQLLGRPVALYTGDWWWRATGRNWDGAAYTPYLWAAPNSGYLGSYPGDNSAHWTARYGGWTDLSVMQYAVAPLYFPDGSQGTIKVSKSAIRNEAVWTALTGEDDQVTQTEFNTLMGTWWAANGGPALAKVLTAVDAVLANVRADDATVAGLRGDLQATAAQLRAGVQADLQQSTRDILEGLAGQVTDPAELADVLRAALGDRATEVGRALQGGAA
jgi:glycosyl hydrolase family 25